MKKYTGTTETKVSEREYRGRALSREAAGEGIVLLENNGVLPLKKTESVALYGTGALFMSKGGFGSGDVNEREIVSPVEGFRNAGIRIADGEYLEKYRAIYEKARKGWREEVLSGVKGNGPRALIDSYLSHPLSLPCGPEIEKTDADTALYILPRQAGEGADRRLEKGDYYLSDAETEDLGILRKMYRKLIVVLNSASVIDLSYIDSIKPDALLLLSQPGMEGGNALADVVFGDVSPSGKLTDTWAFRYEDYPSSKTFHTSLDASERYEDGIYVGYRYFSTFGVRPRIPFGYGLSYTTFSLDAADCSLSKTELRLSVRVQNTGNVPGKEVVQLYCSCPGGRIEKEKFRLCAFTKSGKLNPGEGAFLNISADLSDLWSFDDETGCRILEKGEYIFSIGNSSDNRTAAAVVVLDDDVILSEVYRIGGSEDIVRLHAPSAETEEISSSVPRFHISSDSFSKTLPLEKRKAIDEKVRRKVESLSLSDLSALTCGNPSRGQNVSDTFGSSGMQVPGAAGETSDRVEDIRSLVLADGPAGLRLNQKYFVLPDGRIEKPSFSDTLERGLFAPERKAREGEKAYYQFCTSFPVGTMMAQTWNTDLLRRTGEMVAEEMREFSVDIWLAPGMNIHRNPLCGRNYEYYSEDPFLTGRVASALVEGVQSRGDCGATIKHFACNQRENNRKASDSIVSERALREIYFRGFEIAVKTSNPIAVMSSYNLINGVHAANSHDILTKVLRLEWGYDGLVVSDWTTTGEGGSSPVECMRAGNDLIMPGTEKDREEIMKAVEAGSLDIEDVRYCVSHLISVSSSLREAGHGNER